MLLSLLWEGGAQVKAMLVAGHNHIIVSYINVSGGGGSTQETNSVESHLEFWTSANERASDWLYL